MIRLTAFILFSCVQLMASAQENDMHETIALEEVFEIEISLNLEAYPNPFTNSFFLLSSSVEGEFEILDLSRKVIHSGSLGVQQTYIDMKSFPMGAYFIRVIDEKITDEIRVMKN